MKPIVCIYSEGTDTKVAVVVKEKNKIKILKAATFDVIQPALELEDSISGLKIEGEDLSFEGGSSKTSVDRNMVISSIALLNDSLKEFNLKNSLFALAVTEPSLYYHAVDSSKVGKSVRVTQEIINDIQESKNVLIDRENLGYIELSDGSFLSVFLSGEVGGIKLINSLAHYNNRRYYKISTIKSAEVSLAYYVAKRKKFFPDDQSLIIYIGKEYSKLIFLQGKKLKHIGSTLDIGTLNLHTYDVYFSKILLEMENGGISSLDNIIVCGEDDSENLILSFYGTFPEANVSKLQFDEFDLSSLNSETKEKFSAFSIPASIATEYFDELDEQYKGINLLPKYVIENQKIFQFAWHGLAILPLLFFATFFITLKILNNQKIISQYKSQINEQTSLLKQNQAILSNISNLESKINGFSRTQAILDSASVGTGVWSNMLHEVSQLLAVRKSIWLTKLANDDAGQILIEGYALNKSALTNFAFSIKSAQLKSMIFESLRDKSAYKFNLVFSLSTFQKSVE